MVIMIRFLVFLVRCLSTSTLRLLRTPARINCDRRLSIADTQCYYSLSNATETSFSSIKKRVVSGVQPTESIHLRNLCFVMQNCYETLFFIVDLHAVCLVTPHMLELISHYLLLTLGHLLELLDEKKLCF